MFTTVGSEEKKQFLLNKFPDLNHSNILNSRTGAFEFEIMRATRGQGVNVVLNSLAEEKLQASVRLLSQHGRFLEIGKFDLSNNSLLGELYANFVWILSYCMLYNVSITHH